MKSAVVAGQPKADIIGEIESRRQSLIELSLMIHDNPELGFRETKAAAWLSQYLEENGFSLERGLAGLPTAFRASYGSGSPRIAVLAEYDALPKLGHACGHNIIATSAIGAALAAKQAIDHFGGSLFVIGTPAEELHGGKVTMIKQGIFEGLDAAMMIHPGVFDVVAVQTLACAGLEVEFFGKASHAAGEPEAGISALEAMLQAFTAINSLRQHLKAKSRVHGIITRGGEAANVIPAHTAGSFLVRADDDAYLKQLKDRVLDCFVAGSVATGAQLKYRWGNNDYAPFRANMTLARLFRRNMGLLGRTMRLTDPDRVFGSTDMGNVSQIAPGLHPFMAIAPVEVNAHSPEFARAAAEDRAMQTMLDAAKALAMTVADLVSQPNVMNQVKKEFQSKQLIVSRAH